MVEAIETLIIGGGQAGLSTSYCLSQARQPHLILEQASQLADAWRNHRWDSFTLVTPNWQVRLPGNAYAGSDPDGYLSGAEVVNYLEQYAASFHAPIRFGIRVSKVTRGDADYIVRTDAGDFQATNVVIATGFFQKPKVPRFSASLPATMQQLHSGEYRNPSGLPAGAVLVVGSGQSGCQIAEELYQSGRKVYLSVGSSSGRAPRRYRGKDCMWWLEQNGFFNRTVDMLPSPKAKFAGNPHASGKAGGHTINLHQFVRDGVTLLGRITDAHGATIVLADDLKENLAKADKFEADLVVAIDRFIAENKLDAPEETLPQLRDGFDAKALATLDLEAAGVTCIVWAMGYAYDFSWIDLPVLDEDGYPVQRRGVTAFPGLYFVGLHWQYTAKSDLLFGVGDDAAYVAAQIAARGQREAGSTGLA
jgi:putative flavoprotein involved in K+ transport